MTFTSWPMSASFWGREPATSASPPVLMKGATSEAANRMFINDSFSSNGCGRHTGPYGGRTAFQVLF